MADSTNPSSGADPFTKFWTEATSGFFAASRGGGASSPQEEMLKQARRAFLTAWGEQCEQLLGSEPFLESMRQSMDNAVAFRRQLNDFLKRTIQESQLPTRDDTDSIVDILRNLEGRVVDQLEKLSQRVEALEMGLKKETGAKTGVETGAHGRASKHPKTVQGGGH